MKLTPRMVPYSSIVGGGLSLVDKAGRPHFQVMFIGTTAGITKEETAALSKQFAEALPELEVPDRAALADQKQGGETAALPGERDG